MRHSGQPAQQIAYGAAQPHQLTPRKILEAASTAAVLVAASQVLAARYALLARHNSAALAGRLAMLQAAQTALLPLVAVAAQQLARNLVQVLVVKFVFGDHLMRYAIIENGIAVNVVLADSPLAENWVQSDIAAPGDLYDGEAFTKPGPAVPESVSMAAARKALILGGVSLAAVDAAIDSITDSTERDLARTDWEYAATVRRHSPLVDSLGAAIGLTESEIDALFVAAGGL